MDDLPTTLSGWLRSAVLDTRKAEQDPKYQLDMRYFMFDQSDGICRICMAGANLVFTRGIPSSAVLIEKTTPAIERVTSAIDFMRAGHFRRAYEAYFGKPPSLKEVKYEDALREASRHINDNMDVILRYAPWEIYEEAASVLEEAGL